MKYPPCFRGPRQYAEWKQSARATNLCCACAWCTDCTPEYQHKMIQQGLCIRPDVHFRIDEDGMVEGVVPGRRDMSDITIARMEYLEITF